MRQSWNLECIYMKKWMNCLNWMMNWYVYEKNESEYVMKKKWMPSPAILGEGILGRNELEPLWPMEWSLDSIGEWLDLMVGVSPKTNTSSRPLWMVSVASDWLEPPVVRSFGCCRTDPKSLLDDNTCHKCWRIDWNRFCWSSDQWYEDVEECLRESLKKAVNDNDIWGRSEYCWQKILPG